MDKNFYEILEIDTNASQEIVEKAYKTLAKKYHPDLQTGADKAKYEEKLKLINEAYETLSNEEKRKAYDATLPKNNISQEDYDNLYRQNEYMRNQINNQPNNSRPQGNNANYNPQNNVDQEYINRVNEEYQRQMNDAINKAYHDAYVQDLKNRGYRIRYKKTWKDYVSILITLVIIVVALAILWQIPAVRNYFVDLYNTNSIFRFIVDFFIRLFNTFSKKQ